MLDSVLAELNPHVVLEYAESHGWGYTDPQPSGFWLLECRDRQIQIPHDCNDVGFVVAMRAAVQRLSEMGRLEPESFVLQLRVASQKMNLTLQQGHANVQRFPTCYLLTRLLESGRRLPKFLEINAPLGVVENEEALQRCLLAELCSRFPQDEFGFSLAGVVETLDRELQGSGTH